MEVIKLKDSGIKEIAIENEKGEVVSVLRVNVADREVAERYGKIIDRLTEISEKAEAESQQIEQEYKDKELSIEDMRFITRKECSYIRDIIFEIDALFGKNTIRNVFKENYEIDDCFVPSEDMLEDFMLQIMPIMEKFFKQKFQQTQKKYKARRK